MNRGVDFIAALFCLYVIGLIGLFFFRAKEALTLIWVKYIIAVYTCLFDSVLNSLGSS